jgi:hypothetical protein
MRHNDMDAPDDAPQDAGSELGFGPKSSSTPVSDRSSPPVGDREVPLPNNNVVMLTHQWLDGDATRGTVLATAGGNESVDLWTKINDEAELLRSRTTPLYVHKRIMESLPDDIYRTNQPWYRRPVMLNPTAMIVGAAALLGVGALVAKLAAR